MKTTIAMLLTATMISSAYGTMIPPASGWGGQPVVTTEPPPVVTIIEPPILPPIINDPVLPNPEEERAAKAKKENEDKASRVSQLPKCDLMTAPLLEKAYNNLPYIKVLSLSNQHETGFNLGETSEKGEIRWCTATALLGNAKEEYVAYNALWIDGKAYFKAPLPSSYLYARQ
jgi:hypothetical protein